MRKRLRKKEIKKWALITEPETGVDPLHCEECGRKLKPWSNKYHWNYGTCNSYCYGKMVRVYV
ncbi:hypothetical protein [Paenibacillus polymyxa]|uniref:hypothetical protein n=1 Tax=Paenibacillus polymyxa TaxID=1406 RepID=UPI000B0C132A|nr:hypothetical protein [Paenibacillus polymyxa]WPQ59593.1 hypothetical protein SKN87_28425 [Paenibacillus polymyxa]